MFLQLFKSLLGPHLEYRCYILPNFKTDQVLLENVQRRATRLVKSLQRKSYSERIRSLGLPSLEYRRLRNDMVQTYKIVRDIEIVDKNKLFTAITDARTRVDTGINCLNEGQN